MKLTLPDQNILEVEKGVTPRDVAEAFQLA